MVGARTEAARTEAGRMGAAGIRTRAVRMEAAGRVTPAAAGDTSARGGRAAAGISVVGGAVEADLAEGGRREVRQWRGLVAGDRQGAEARRRARPADIRRERMAAGATGARGVVMVGMVAAAGPVDLHIVETAELTAADTAAPVGLVRATAVTAIVEVTAADITAQVGLRMAMQEATVATAPAGPVMATADLKPGVTVDRLMAETVVRTAARDKAVRTAMHTETMLMGIRALVGAVTVRRGIAAIRG
jgi:hypothetical protein